jgi:hypothetical protein
MAMACCGEGRWLGGVGHRLVASAVLLLVSGATYPGDLGGDTGPPRRTLTTAGSARPGLWSAAQAHVGFPSASALMVLVVGVVVEGEVLGFGLEELAG